MGCGLNQCHGSNQTICLDPWHLSKPAAYFSFSGDSRSEDQLQSDLHLTHVHTCASDLAEVGADDAGVRRGQIRVVGRVERFEAELQAARFQKADDLADRRRK